MVAHFLQFFVEELGTEEAAGWEIFSFIIDFHIGIEVGSQSKFVLI